MTVEMGIRCRATGEYRVVPIATAASFRQIWLPACKDLGLELVSRFQGGSLTIVSGEAVSQIIEELQRLRGWCQKQADKTFLVERIDGILQVFRETDPAAYEYDFG